MSKSVTLEAKVTEPWLFVDGWFTKGVLSDVVTEAYRRLTADYEDQKIKDNFDIWSLQGLITE